MSRNIDYSKWDRMNFSESESDSSDDEKGTGMDGKSSDLCRVTRLDQPSRVTVSGGQVNVEETSSASASASFPSSSTTQPAKMAAVLPPSSTVTTQTTITDTSSSAEVEESSSSPKEASQEAPTHAPTPPASWTNRGSFVEACNLYWSQDRYTVTLRFQLPVAAAVSAKASTPLPAGVLPWDCHVSGILPYEQRHAAVQSLTTDHCATLVITDNTTGTEYVRDHVAYPIHAEQDDHDSDNLTDWSIETWPADGLAKYLIVTLYKATPVPDMTIWWRRPLRSCPEIDLTADHTMQSQSQQTNTFAAAWEQAHAQFRQGRQDQEQERVEIDVGDDDKGDET
jgi:hypothetical protein